jgi:hypothetical protein
MMPPEPVVPLPCMPASPASLKFKCPRLYSTRTGRQEFGVMELHRLSVWVSGVPFRPVGLERVLARCPLRAGALAYARSAASLRFT